MAFGVGTTAGAILGPTPSARDQMPPAPKGGGVVSSTDGYRFVARSTSLSPTGGTFRFVVEGPKGEAVKRYTKTHEKLLHFILVNRELTSFQHVHPTLARDGTWSIELPALSPGSYRAIADFQVADGPHLALGTDLAVAGPYRPTQLEEPRSKTNVDGYDVTIATKSNSAGEVKIAMTIRKDGRLVTDLQPYLGAFGHLVALRSGDLAYAHVHPIAYTNGVVHFDAELPSEGRYGLFLDFRHGNSVHTATFTLDQSLVTGTPTMEH
jgi:hypothetical protein